MHPIDRQDRTERREYSAGPVALYVDDLDGLLDRVRRSFGRQCSLFVDVAGIDPYRRVTYTHSASSFSELKDNLGSGLQRGFLIQDAAGRFKLEFDPVHGVHVFAEGDEGLNALRAVEEVLRTKRRWVSWLLAVPIWKLMLVYAIGEAGWAVWKGVQPSVLWIVWMTTILFSVIIYKPELFAGRFTSLWLVRRHERTVVRDILWNAVVPLSIGVVVTLLRVYMEADRP